MRKSHPVIALCLRSDELWRRSWVDRTSQIVSLIATILESYPRAAIVIDGMTSYDNQRSIARDNSVDADLVETLQKMLPVCSMIWWSLPDKVAIYKCVDYANR